ncbi:MAG: biotin--[acetyl-CoA-carboxylase] ligase [Sphingobacteriaceae bacterium]|nr:MAG: biotin--[acetyl-CoA-carboxylase] ligase [Sphingobacteriaceae bacterium]
MQNNTFSALFVGQNLLTLKEVNSTNDFLKNLLSNSKPLPEGTVIMAESQFAGRGQHENKWHSDPGKNLTFSLLLNPTFLAVDEQFDLNRVISLGVVDALEPLLGNDLKIKWPNDIYYGDKKLGGILIENMIQGSQIKNAIIGIGLNVNQDNFPGAAANATSLKQILHKYYDLRMLLSDICSHIEAWYIKLRDSKKETVRIAYLDRLYWLNQQKQFSSNNTTFTGVITNVKNNGLLVVINEQCDEVEFSLKEIEFLNK